MGSRDTDRSRRAAPEDDRIIHARLLQRDPVAPSDLAVRCLASLTAGLRRAFPRVDPAACETVAIDVLLGLGERPEQFDPSRAPLAAFLLMAAKRDVLNILERDRRRASRRVPLDVVELSPRARNSMQDCAADPANTVPDALDDDLWTALQGQLGAQEREFVQLMMDGERRTTVFADVLGLQGRPDVEQAREVKRTKDRLKKRLQRRWPPATRGDA